MAEHLVATHAPQAVIETPESAYGRDEIALRSVLLGDAAVQFEQRGAFLNVEPSGHLVAAQCHGPCAIGHLHAVGLQIELPHHLRHVLAKVLHALFGLRLGQFQLRLRHTDTSFAPPPVEQRQRESDAGILLIERMSIRFAQRRSRLREPELDVEVGLQPAVGLGISQITLAL